MYDRMVHAHMACPLKFTFLFVIKFCIFGGLECANNTDVISHCIDNQPCIGTYKEIYNDLALEQNSFNIRSALYPVMRPSSVRVFVNVYGPDGTQNPRSNAVKYTWSTNCLFVALPAAVLQVMSLGSILVDPRTQHLNITLRSFFCCKVSEDRREKMIKNVIAELEDLAVSPTIPDPRLNTAECVIEGHESNIKDTGRSGFIYAMLICSYISVILLGPLLSFFILRFLTNYENRCFQNAKPIVHATDVIAVVMLLIDFVIIPYYFSKSCETGLPKRFIVVIILEGPLIILVINLYKYIQGKLDNQGTQGDNRGNQGTQGGNRGNQGSKGGYGGNQGTEGGNRGNQGTEGGNGGKQGTQGGNRGNQGSKGGYGGNQGTEGGNRGNQGTEGGNGGKQGTQGCKQATRKRIVAEVRRSIYFIWVHLVLNHLFWLVIGIMITPTWGLTVLLIICLFIIVSFFVVYHVFKVIHAGGQRLQAGLFSGVCFVGFCCAVVVPVIAGNSFYGRETADSVLKVVLLYIITGLVPKIIQFYDSQSSNEGGTPVQNVPTTQNSSASTASASGPTSYREADNDLELHEIETQGEERSRLLMNTSR
ncbi:uncharacterized protein LOC110063498 isoform X2 [Orbicella faveolata]|uniref:uncharacterized protein LOC110063498 isoform X2 n=1 Tax=Orbicella faveolata TaxID=48498 RepID=UPI0009E57FDC|nr:uncharacterized protein LOC110063498 isoform X2 [Orbicella faveolata]